MKALIGMSGGVDSSVAAWLTMENGDECVGATMRLFTGNAQDTADAQQVARRLGIDFHVLDLSEDFRRRVMEPFAACYEAGLTPNPCIECNRHLKFGAFLEKARQMGCDCVVTGHYARIDYNEETHRYQLRKALDEAKDQTYFLYTLTQQQLRCTRLPLGEKTKAEVREIAEKQGFLNARKRDSQDICFVPDGDYAAFLRRFTGKCYPAGNYLDLKGNIVGQHQGAVCYTLGQRKGLNLAMGEPVYVCSKNMAENTVTVGPNEALMHRSLRAKDCNWISIDRPNAPIRVKAKARSRMSEEPATLYPEETGTVRVEFDVPQRALTPGQAVVFYNEDLVIGGGTITEII